MQCLQGICSLWNEGLYTERKRFFILHSMPWSEDLILGFTTSWLWTLENQNFQLWQNELNCAVFCQGNHPVRESCFIFKHIFGALLLFLQLNTELCQKQGLGLWWEIRDGWSPVNQSLVFPERCQVPLTNLGLKESRSISHIFPHSFQAPGWKWHPAVTRQHLWYKIYKQPNLSTLADKTMRGFPFLSSVWAVPALQESCWRMRPIKLHCSEDLEKSCATA